MKKIFLSLLIIRMCFGESLLWAHKLLGANTGFHGYTKHSPFDGCPTFTINIYCETVNTCNVLSTHINNALTSQTQVAISVSSILGRLVVSLLDSVIGGAARFVDFFSFWFTSSG
jgi:hypothetical protein